MIERTINLNGKVTFGHDKEMFNLIYTTAARMYFPGKANDRRKRDAYLEVFAHKNLDPELSSKLRNSLLKSYRKGYLAGEVFFKRCQMTLYIGRAPSLNEMLYAAQKGFYDQWKAKGFPSGIIKSTCKAFSPVLHLWAAHRYFQGYTGKNEPPEYYLHHTPCLFLRIAHNYRECASNYAMIDRRSALWMPQGWKDAASQVAVESDIAEEKGAREEAERLEAVFSEYREERIWDWVSG